MAVDRIISSDDNINENSKGLIGTDSAPVENETSDNKNLSLADRISLSTESKGLKVLPDRFDEQDGDWIIIKSVNPFEILYLDYKQYRIISPETVKNNYDILLKFWSDKVNMMNTGGNRVAYSKKFGEKTVETSIDTLKKAYDKISSEKGIENYYQEINNARLNEGREKLNKELKPILADKIIDISEMEYLFSNASVFELSDDECALIIEKLLKENNIISKGKVSGVTLKEQLLSVRWMSQDKLVEELQRDKERESAKIKLLGKFASSIEEIGTILFENPVEAKEIIKEDLLKQSISQKDIDVARVVGAICKNAKNIDMAYIEVVYKLNNTLPYRFTDQKLTSDPSQLCTFFAENNKTIVSGKDHLKKGYVEIWLKETNKDAYNSFVKIRDAAPNIDLAFLEFLYTFNPKLPYRFAGDILVNTPKDLCSEINKNTENWDAGKKELFNSSILVWLKTSGNSTIVDQWEKVKNQYKGSEDVGLEHFLHILNKDIKYANITANMAEISFPKIQSGDIINQEINFKNETRGYTVCDLSLSNNIEGVTLNVSKLFFNAAANFNEFNPILKIDTSNLIRGQLYTTEIKFSSSAGQEITIPVSFKIVFPKHAFIQEIVKSAIIFAIIGILIRLAYNLIGYSGWVNERISYYLDIKDIDYFKALGLEQFSLIFFSLLALAAIVIFFRKPLLNIISKTESLIMNLFKSKK